MFSKVIAVRQSKKIHSLNFNSTSLRYELFQGNLSPVEDMNQAITITKIADALSQEIIKDPNRHIINILYSIQDTDPSVLELIKAVKKPQNINNIETIKKNIAYKALIVVIRTWEKEDYHVHFSYAMDGKFVSDKKGVHITEPYDFENDQLHIDDSWIKNMDDYKEAWQYVLEQYFEDGVTSLSPKFNPYKKFLSDTHEGRIKWIKPVLIEVGRLFRQQMIKQKQQTGIDHDLKFMFSLNRIKYGSENPQHFIDIIDELVKIKQENPDQVSDLLYAIDVCGRELLPWEYDYESGRFTKIGKKLINALNKAADVGFKNIAHLGDLRNFNQDLAIKLGNDPDKIQYHSLKYTKAYLLNIDGLTRLGHVGAISFRPNMSAKTLMEMQDVISILKGIVPRTAFTVINKIQHEDSVNIWEALENEGILTSGVQVNKSLGEQEIENALINQGIILKHTKVKKIMDILSRVRNAKNILLERCYYDQIENINQLRNQTPVYFWQQQGLNFVFGIDGLIHETEGTHEYGEKCKYEAVSLSQWLALVMLAAPRDLNPFWTVAQIKEIAKPGKD